MMSCCSITLDKLKLLKQLQQISLSELMNKVETATQKQFGMNIGMNTEEQHQMLVKLSKEDQQHTS